LNRTCQLCVAVILHFCLCLTVSKHQHKHFNQLLNGLKTAPSQSSTPLDYHHLYLVDSFYQADGNEREKVRVTRNEKTNQVVECVRKVRLGDLNIYSPKRAADWRVSVNVELPGAFLCYACICLSNIQKVSHPIGSASMTRRKDRLSYSHEEFSIDLTQVTSSTNPNSQVSVLSNGVHG